MLKHIKGNTYTIDLHGTCSGVYRIDTGSVVLIDSGREPAPDFIQWLNRNHLRVEAILHTHLHIDHVANTEELAAKYGCDVYASVRESRYEDHEEEYICCDVNGNREDETICIRQKKFETVFTPGHSSGHQLIATPDGVCFVGDAILTERVLRASLLPYMENIQQSLHSMERIDEADYGCYIASHKGLIRASDIHQVVEMNRQKHLKLYDILKECAGIPSTEDELTERFLEKIGIFSEKIRGYGWIQDTARQRIHELIDQKQLKSEGSGKDREIRALGQS